MADESPPPPPSRKSRFKPIINRKRKSDSKASSGSNYNEQSRDELVCLAKLAKQAGVYRETIEIMHMVFSSSSAKEITIEERDLLVEAYKNEIGSRRAAINILSAMEGEEESSSSSSSSSSNLVKYYRFGVESEILELFNGVSKLSRYTSTRGNCFYEKMASDCQRYLQQNPLASSPPMAIEETRAGNLFLAKLAKKTKRYDDMLRFMENVFRSSSLTTEEERDLLHIAYKKVMIGHGSQPRLESKLSAICHGMLKLLESILPSSTTCESKVFYWKMKGDCLTDLAKFKVEDELKDAVKSSAELAYQRAKDIAAELDPLHSIRLGLSKQISIREQHYINEDLLIVPKDLLERIATKLSRNDLLNFSRVNKLFKSIAISTHLSLKHFPELLIRSSQESDRAYILSFNEESGLFEQRFEVSIPMAMGHIHGCCYGWLFMTKDLQSSLYHPFSSEKISLPLTNTLPSRETKIIISSNPSLRIPATYVLIISYGGLSLTRVGDDKWLMEFRCKDGEMIADAIYFEKKFYVLNFVGMLKSFEVREDEVIPCEVILCASISEADLPEVFSYLVELHGEFFRLVLQLDQSDEDSENLQVAVVGELPELDEDGDDNENLQVAVVGDMSDVDGEGELPDDYDDDEEDDEDDEDDDYYQDNEEDDDEDENDYQDEDDTDFVSEVKHTKKLLEQEKLLEEEDRRIRVYGFKIQTIESKIWIDVEEGLGEVAVFVGGNSSFALQEGEFPGIYFTGDQDLQGGRVGNNFSLALPVSVPIPAESICYWVDCTPQLLGASDFWFDD